MTSWQWYVIVLLPKWSVNYFSIHTFTCRLFDTVLCEHHPGPQKLVLHFPAMSCVGPRRGNMLLINTLAHVSEVRSLESVCLMFDLFPQRMMSSLFYWLRAICTDMPEGQLRQLDLQVFLTKGVARAGPRELTAQKSSDDLCWRMNKIFFHHSVNLVVVNCQQRMDRNTVLTWIEHRLVDPNASWLR